MIGEMIIANYLKDIDLAQIERDNVAQEQVDYSFDLWLDKMSDQPLILELDGLVTVFESTSDTFSTYRD